MNNSSQSSSDATPAATPGATPDATSEPLQPQSFDEAASRSNAPNDLDALLGQDDEPTIFDEIIEPQAEHDAEYQSDETEAPNDFENDFDDEDEEAHVAGYVEPRPPRWRTLLVWLVLLGGIGGGAFYYKMKADAKEARRWAPMAMPDKMAFVPTDWGAATLAQKLKKSDKIRDVDAFVESAKAVDLSNVIPGGYALPDRAGPRDLARIFKAGPTHEEVVIPPGYTGVQIVNRLQKAGFAGAGDMENLIYPAKGFSPYEGTMAPGTYWMPLKADGKTLIAQTQEEFAQMLKKLPKPYPKVNGRELTKTELVTIASLVERESNLKDEMPKVAGVMMNRLNKPMRLQIDASVQYARIMADEEHKSRLYFKDYKFQSPFNTYLNDGLPPTPICNPGMNALMAAARPTATSALFYVYSPKAKKHIFADDFEGHKENVARARRERAAIEAAKS